MNGTQSTYPPDVVTQQPTPLLDLQPDDGHDHARRHVRSPTPRRSISTTTTTRARVESENYNYQPAPAGIGAFQRREVAVAIGNCNGTTNGAGTVPLLGFGCFYLLQQAQQQGNESYIYGQFLEDCRAGGMPGPAPTSDSGPVHHSALSRLREHAIREAAMSHSTTTQATGHRDGRSSRSCCPCCSCCCSASRRSAARSCATTRLRSPCRTARVTLRRTRCSARRAP